MSPTKWREGFRALQPADTYELLSKLRDCFSALCDKITFLLQMREAEFACQVNLTRAPHRFLSSLRLCERLIFVGGIYEKAD